MKYVVHCKKAEFDVYIGRIPGGLGEWGNPFSSKPHSNAVVLVKDDAMAVKYHKEWIDGERKIPGLTPPTKERIKEVLKGKVLGCWCKQHGDEPCHGDTLSSIANS